MAYEFSLPGRTIIGENALEASESYIKSFGKKAFIVSGKIVTKTGLVKKLTDYLTKWKIDFVVFNDITEEPTTDMIECGVKAYKEEKCDFCIAIGGGSPLDSGKAIVAMTKLDGEISDYMGISIEGDFPPLVLIPTTAGTGSEATKLTVITDTKKNIKMLLRGESLLPDLAILDYKFTLTAPKSITAATGMDALTHAVEAYTSRKANPLTDTFALSAIKKIFTFLPMAYKNGEDERAREQMVLAAYEAGICINNSSVTLVHGMSRPIGALFHVPHGISNAMLIRECLAYVLDGSYERFGAIGKAINAADDKATDKEAAEAFLDKLTELCKACEIPTLQQYGVDKEKFNELVDKMAQDAINSGSPSNTIKEVKKDDLVNIYYKLW
ncbi:1,3-propanediol dehydrogenase [Clostridium zeae]|uniref:1,3-propanediol dehydrogenase n=1 Tax=Clostridium zeae TaxID=2759022 RepID=A0ABQ1EGG3_9CLOT|nr:iron-containing alcohol dehydrogenase [Clostridium zeae]GFZ33734.1 1,3-propanediol dehydrogenase [Clostridium zeae]